MVTARGELLSLIYASTATQPFSSDDLDALHTLSRVNNERVELTGLLLHHGDRFVQVLEGPEESVHERMAVIGADARHTDVRMLAEERIERRRFPHWAMEYRPLSPSMADTIPGYNAVFAGLEHDADRAAVERPLEALMRWYQARASQAW